MAKWTTHNNPHTKKRKRIVRHNEDYYTRQALDAALWQDIKETHGVTSNEYNIKGGAKHE